MVDQRAATLYAANISNLFHTVTEFGAATCPESHLLRWLGYEKTVPSFWAEVHQQFVNALEPEERQDGWQLYVIENSSHLTLICMDPEDAPLKDRWAQRVRILAERPAPGRKKKAKPSDPTPE